MSKNKQNIACDKVHNIVLLLEPFFFFFLYGRFIDI